MGKEKEFQEIYLSGGRIEFKKEQNGSVSPTYEGSDPLPVRVFQVCVSYIGKIIDTVPFQAIYYPQPSLIVLVLSDQHGMFGRHCPKCNSYYRTDVCPGDRYCVYCGFSAKSVNFLTQNQIKYIGAFCNSLIKASVGDNDIILDLDKLKTELPQNKPEWLYSEESQQNSYHCPKCRTKFDILGEYGLCPCCAKPNLEMVFDKKMQELQSQFEVTDKNITDRQKREAEWSNLLIRCVSEFESMANQVRKYLLLFPATPVRKQSLSSVSFQSILNVNEKLKEWYSIEFLEGAKNVDKDFLKIMFNRRHIFTHNAGRVDQEYIDNTDDTSVKLNQLIHVRSNEIKRLIPLVSQSGKRLIQGFESIA